MQRKKRKKKPLVPQNAFLETFKESDREKIISYTEKLTFPKETVIIQYYTNDSALYIALKGDFEVWMPEIGAKNFRKIALLPPNSTFGELSFLDGAPRSAMVKVATDAEVLKLTRASYGKMLAEDPKLAYIFLLQLTKLLSQRLRHATKKLSVYL
jgi:CRP/FNR family transcriptional regulator, cyclic AMP receptor protein